jgi:hypothetical protein
MYFTMTIFVAIAQQSVQATLGSLNRSTPKFGFNTNAHIPPNFPTPGYSGANWTQQWFIDSTAYLYPEVLRFPGGTNANHWDWQTGWYFPAYLPPGGTSLTIRTDEFKPGILGCNGEGLYVVNLETSNVHYEMDGLRHTDSIGLNPKFIELGNEHNLNGGSQFPLQLMTPTNYAQLAKVFYDSIMLEFPTAKVCAVGGNTPAIPHWIDTVLSYIPLIDAISFHVYLNANNADLAFNVNRSLAVPFGPNSNTSSLLYRYNMSGFNTLLPSKEVWVTEFNLLESPSGIPSVISQTWTHVLYNIAMCNFFLTKPNISMILNHSLAGDNHFQSISRQNKKITANALSMKLLYDMSRGSQSCQNMNFSGNPAMIYGTSTIPKLVGWKFNYPGMEKGFICNFSNDTFAISLSTLFGNPMQFDQYYADTVLVVNGISSLNKYSANSSDTIIVYPYSITQINSVISTGTQYCVSGKNELCIYPNPANSNMIIQIEINLNNADIYIYDVSSKEVIRLKKISGNSFSFSIGSLTKGTYFVKIISDNKITTGKFIVD